MAETKATTPAPAKGGAPKKGPPAGGGKSKGKADKAQAGATEAQPKVSEGTPRLLDYYQKTIRGRLQQQFGLANAKVLDAVVEELTRVCGQRPVITRAKKAISNFGLRAGVPVGVAVTLRSARMYEFLDRFISLAVPRIRDFRGLPNRSFDGRGNYSFGIKEQLIFPEIDYDRVEKIHGMDITIVTTAARDDLALALLREFGWPFRGETPKAVAV